MQQGHARLPREPPHHFRHDLFGEVRPSRQGVVAIGLPHTQLYYSNPPAGFNPATWNSNTRAVRILIDWQPAGQGGINYGWPELMGTYCHPLTGPDQEALADLLRRLLLPFAD